MLLASKLELNPNGSSCSDVKATNSAGRSTVFCMTLIGSSESSVGRVAIALEMVDKFQEPEEEWKVDERNNVRKFVERRMKRKKRLVNIDLDL